MKRFGFGKKEDGGSVLSLGRKKPQDDANPYAQQNDDDAQSTFSRSTAASSASYGSGLPSGPKAGLPSGPRGGYAAPPPPYASPQPGPGYANDRFGTPGGYGNNRFESATSQTYNSYQANQSVAIQQPPMRKGGYGGLGEENRDELLANARPSFVNQQRASEPVSDGYGQSALSGGSYGGGYGDDRELTEEEKAHQELLDTKAQINQVRDATVMKSRDLVELLGRTEETAFGTANTVYEQGVRMQGVRGRLITAEDEAIASGDGLKELNVASNMLHFRGAKAKAQEADSIVRRKQATDLKADELRREIGQKNAQYQREQQEIFQPKQPSSLKGRPAAGNKFMFDDEEDDDVEKDRQRQQEEEIDQNLELISQGVGRLNRAAVHIGNMVDDQNKSWADMEGQIDNVKVRVDKSNAYMRTHFKK